MSSDLSLKHRGSGFTPTATRLSLFLNQAKARALWVGVGSLLLRSRVALSLGDSVELACTYSTAGLSSKVTGKQSGVLHYTPFPVLVLKSRRGRPQTGAPLCP